MCAVCAVCAVCFVHVRACLYKRDHILAEAQIFTLPMLVFCSFQVAQRLLDELDASPTAAAELSDLEKFPYLKVRMQAHAR